MKPKPNSKHKLFNLDNDVITLIEEGSNINSMNQSEFVEFLVNAWDESINPIKKLKSLRSKKKLLDGEIIDIEAEENVIMDNVQKLESWRKVKQEKRPEMVGNLVRMILEGRNIDAEVTSRNMSIRLGVPASQLILDALQQINVEKRK